MVIVWMAVILYRAHNVYKYPFSSVVWMDSTSKILKFEAENLIQTSATQYDVSLTT